MVGIVGGFLALEPVELVGLSGSEYTDPTPISETCPQYDGESMTLDRRIAVLCILGGFSTWIALGLRGVNAFCSGHRAFYLARKLAAVHYLVFGAIATSLMFSRISETLQPETLASIADIKAFETEFCTLEDRDCVCSANPIWGCVVAGCIAFCVGGGVFVLSLIAEGIALWCAWCDRNQHSMEDVELVAEETPSPPMPLLLMDMKRGRLLGRILLHEPTFRALHSEVDFLLYQHKYSEDWTMHFSPGGREVMTDDDVQRLRPEST